MINIYVQSTHLKVSYEEATKSEIRLSEKILISRFKAIDTSVINSPAYKSGRISAEKTFYISEMQNVYEDKNLLPSGFLPYLEAYYEKNKLEYTINDLRKFPKIDKTFLKALTKKELTFNGLIPRDDQIQSLIKIAQNRQGIIMLPTGVGKTLLLVLICKLYPTAKILLPFNSISLIHQTYNDFLEYGIKEKELGIIQANNIIDDKRITLLSIASYEKAFHIFPHIKVIIADEAHSLGCGVADEQATKVLYACQNASIRIGVTATADTIDNPYKQMGLYGNLGPIIYKKTIQEKIDDKTLSNIKIQMYKQDTYSIPVCGSYADIYEYDKESKNKKGEWEQIKKDGEIIWRRFVAYGDESTHYVYNIKRNKLITQVALQHPRCVILYRREEHGKILYKQLIESGYENVLNIYGGDSIKKREEAKQFLLTYEDSIVLASDIWKKGVNVPWIKTLMNVSGGVDTNNVIQKLGRATRKDKETGKENALLIDFYDSFSKLGRKQSDKRLKVYKDVLGFDVEII